VVQEVVVAKKVVIVCGGYALLWGHFWLASSVTISHYGAFMATVVTGYTVETNPSEVRVLMSRVDRLREAVRNVTAITLIKTKRTQGETLSSLYSILKMYRSTNSTDPLDKVYAFLGLAHGDHNEIAGVPIDYTMSPAVLYRLVAKQHLETRKSLNFLNDCYGIGRPAGFSSWSPALETLSWSLVGQLEFMECPPHFIYTAASDLDLRFDFAQNEEILRLAGTKFDTVKAIGAISDLRLGETINGLSYTPDNVREVWEDLAGVGGCNKILQRARPENRAEISRSFAPYPSGGISKHEAWIRTLLANPDGDLHVNYYNSKVGFDMEHKWESRTLGPGGTEDKLFRIREGQCTMGRRFYVTSKGYFGLGPPVTAVGDVVCIFSGAKTPFLLRPEGRSFKIVAETYVQGLMSGEVALQIRSWYLDVEMIPLI
jgi:hypothetical protein